MTVKTALRACGLATALTIGLVLLGSPASAGAPTVGVPPAIVAWFAHDAGRVAGDVLETNAAGLEPSRFGGRYSAGSPAQLHDWNSEFISGTSNQAALVRDEWVATLYRDGQVVGTIAATLSPAGQPSFSYADDDVAAGKALASRDGAGKLVQDPRMGGLVEVRPDGTASGMSTVAVSTVNRVAGAADLRAAIGKAHVPGPLDSVDQNEGGNGAPADGGGDAPLGFALALTVAGLVLWLAWRRPQPRPAGRR